MTYPKEVILLEVGPRDGLQNEPTFLDSQAKITFINQLSQSGLSHIEVTSFVAAKAIPQLADHDLVFKGIKKFEHCRYSALVPNEQGMLAALDCQVQEIALFTSASETFCQRNINCSIAQSLERFKAVLALAKKHHIFVRGYISCALGCPYEGAIAPKNVAKLASQLLDLNIDELCLADTIGVGTVKQTSAVVNAILPLLNVQRLAMHFHDTYGQAIANIVCSLDFGIRRFDTAVAGLGGCPYARGASGNVATEDVLYLMHGLGIETGVDIYKVVSAGDLICKTLKRTNQSKVARALLSNR